MYKKNVVNLLENADEATCEMLEKVLLAANAIGKCPEGKVRPLAVGTSEHAALQGVVMYFSGAQAQVDFFGDRRGAGPMVIAYSVNGEGQLTIVRGKRQSGEGKKINPETEDQLGTVIGYPVTEIPKNGGFQDLASAVAHLSSMLGLDIDPVRVRAAPQGVWSEWASNEHSARYCSGTTPFTTFLSRERVESACGFSEGKLYENEEITFDQLEVEASEWGQPHEVNILRALRSYLETQTSGLHS